jgi:SAM-dependent methyltransferase
MTLLILIVFLLFFALAGWKGAPYVPILKRESDGFFKLADLKPGQTLIDLGSGDGRLLRAAAKRGVHCIGYEINPIMVLISKIVCWRYRKLVTIHLADMWRADLPPADVIYVFLLPRYMEQLDHWLSQQITRPTRLISYAFEIPSRKPITKTPNTFVYEYGSAARP